MPRQSRGRSSSAPRSAPAPAPVQSRGAHTAAAPAAGYAQPHAPAPPAAAANAGSHAQPQQPGMLASMAATAGSIAVGSTIGHGISHMLFGGSSEAAPAQTAPVQHQQQPGGISCEAQAKEFTKCLDKADLQSCSWYLEQLKACQAAASPY